MRTFFTFLLSLAFITVQAQSLDLEKGKNNESLSSQELFVRVQFPNYVDWLQKIEDWDAEGIPAEQRPKLVNRILLKQSKAAQKEFLNSLQAAGIEISRFQQHYIVNCIIMQVTEAQKAYIKTNHPEVEVHGIHEKLAPVEFIEVSTSTKNTGIQNTESGVKAINSEAMWQLGYSGKGTKVFIFDSGVWSQHPAFANRFLGHYRPMDQAWQGLFTDHPSGVNSNHGTHVCGTAVGMDPRTNDSIGVAHGAYWMANDLINASTAAGLPDLSLLFASFEWALNPDGDTSTTDDVPDVINNSWRWRDEPDTVQCGGYVPGLMMAIEAAGIANVFSGGNTGPNNAVLNAPQRIKMSDVNVFSVGSVNGNIAFPHPISGFSTRGPTQCPTSGTLDIHPEVVAPGENVRSAWNADGYNNISGTSMSSPHVSGAVLLLKEAFPNLTGAQLLMALYTTAIDMGVAGEDNTYGNGLIDVHAAYQWLAQQHTPVDPQAIDFDLAITDFYSLGMAAMGCDTVLTLEIVLENKGLQPINQISLQVLNAVSNTSVPPTYAVQLPQKGSIDTITLNGTYVINRNGAQEVQVIASIDSADYDPVNNSRVLRYHALPFYELANWSAPPLTEFNLGIRSDLWFIDNEDLGVGWDTVNSSIPNESWATVQMSSYDPANNQKDALISPVIKFNSPGGGAATLLVEYAYRPLGPVPFLHDTFRIKASTDCGMTFSHLIFEAWGDSLMTTSNYGSNFIPSSLSDFRTMQFLSELPQGTDEMIFSFETTNRKGNNIYIRSIEPGQILSINDLAKRFNVFPNPSNGYFTLEAKGMGGQLTNWSILDIQGRVLRSGSFSDGQMTLDISDFATGVYSLELRTEDQKEIHRLIKR